MDQYSHILAPLDFSEATGAVLQRALQERQLHSARLTLLHVIEYYPEDVPPGLVPPENANPVTVYLDRARRQLAGLADEAGARETAQLVATSTGAAYHEIVHVAKEEGADLIVMGYAGRWVTDTLGSTAMAVVRHVVCDVLLVRSGLPRAQVRA